MGEGCKPCHGLQQEKSLEEQSHLLQVAQEAGKEATEEILALLPEEDSPYLTPVVAREDILTPALQTARNHTEMAIKAVNTQLSTLVHDHVLPPQAGVFLATLFQVLCFYQQEMDGMVTNQVILLGQIIPDLWGGQSDPDGGPNPPRPAELSCKLASFPS